MIRLAIWILCAASLHAQGKPEFDFSQLSGKAAETVEVNLDGKMLEMASRFLSSNNADEAEIKKLLNNLRGVYVRSFKFAKPGEYSSQDVESLRAHVKGKDWAKIVDVRSNKPGGENAGVYVNTDGSEVKGIMVIAAEARELTVVNIIGNINPEQLRTLGGKWGIPKMDIPVGAVKGFVNESKKKQDEDE